MWRTQAQIDFLNGTFGNTDPVRLRNQCNYLKQQGYNITFKEYAGYGHVWTQQMINDIFNFLAAYK